MLQVPRLDGDDYESIFQRAKARIPTLTEEWTNFNASDPGITTLETFAWLFDTLHYYMNASGEVHRLKYFKLLGIEPVQRPAECVLALEGPGPVDLPRGTRVQAGDVSFETTETLQGPTNRLTALWLEQEGRRTDLTARAGVDGGFAPLFTPQSPQSSTLYLGFAGPLSGTVRLYLELEAQPRTLFDETFRLAQLGWEAFDGETWRPVHVERDETCGLLRSGFLTLILPGPAVVPGDGQTPAGCCLRCRLLENHYDLTPRLGRVLPCCVRAEQVRTWARAEELVCDGSLVLEPDFCVGADTLVEVYVRCAGEEAYTRWCSAEHRADDLAEVRLPDGRGRMQIIFDADRFGKAPAAGDMVLVTALSPQAAEMAYLGCTDGCAGQRMDIDAENISSLTLALLRPGPDGRPVCRLWQRCDDLMEAGWDDCVFSLDERERQVVFGDSLRGRQPEAGWDVMAVEIRTSRFEGGNVVAGSVTALQEPIPGVARVYNPAPAQGGCRRKTAAQLQTELDEEMMTPARAVTQEDYRAIAMATPGLMLDSVAVIPMKEYCRTYPQPAALNTVVVAVKPRSRQRLPVLSEVYRRAVAAHLEHSRILTTDIRVVPARYIGVSVYGRLWLRPGETGGRARVEAVIRSAVETLHTGEYGRGVDCGRLFSALELESCVQRVERLSLEYIGQGGGKNEHGDITAGPDCLTYLLETGIEYM